MSCCLILGLRHGGLIVFQLVDGLLQLFLLIEQRALGRIVRGGGVRAQPHHGERGREAAFAVFRRRDSFSPSPLPVSSRTECSVARRFCVSKNSVVFCCA